MMMNVPEQAIREGLKRNALPIGWAEKRSSVWTYYIIKERVEAFIKATDMKMPSAATDGKCVGKVPTERTEIF